MNNFNDVLQQKVKKKKSNIKLKQEAIPFHVHVVHYCSQSIQAHDLLSFMHV